MNTDPTSSSSIPAVEVSTQAAAQTITPNQNDTIDNSANASNGITSTASNQDQTDSTNMSATSTQDAPAIIQVQKAEATVAITPAIPSLAPAPTDPQHIVNLKAAIVTALLNPEYVKDSKRVEKSTNSFKMPDEEARVRAQLKSHAEKKLRADAALEAEKTGVYTAPTLAEIEAHIEKGLKTWRIKNKK